MAEKHTNLDDLEGHECPRCERTHPGPDYDGQPGFCTQPWGTDPDCERIYVAALETRLRASEAECERLRRVEKDQSASITYLLGCQAAALEENTRLRREVEDVASWLWRMSQLNDTRIREAGYMQEAGDRLRAAVEYLEKERKDG